MKTVLAQKIKNIIFDYGNVIFEIDFQKAQNALSQLGISNITDFFGHRAHHNIFSQFETGEISSAEFRNQIRLTACDNELNDEQIDSAWNSLLIGVPSKEVHDTLLEAKEKYRTFLLSNTNEIHFNWIIKHLEQKYNIADNDDLFERAYYSQQMKLRKPNKEIFQQVLEENKLNPGETLFIDDSPQHLEGARLLGIHTLLMDRKPALLKAFLTDHGLL